MDCSPWGSFVLRILQARILEWVAIFISRGSSWPRDWTPVSCRADSLLLSTRDGQSEMSEILEGEVRNEKEQKHIEIWCRHLWEGRNGNGNTLQLNKKHEEKHGSCQTLILSIIFLGWGDSCDAIFISLLFAPSSGSLSDSSLFSIQISDIISKEQTSLPQEQFLLIGCSFRRAGLMLMLKGLLFTLFHGALKLASVFCCPTPASCNRECFNC